MSVGLAEMIILVVLRAARIFRASYASRTWRDSIHCPGEQLFNY